MMRMTRPIETGGILTEAALLGIGLTLSGMVWPVVQEPAGSEISPEPETGHRVVEIAAKAYDLDAIDQSIRTITPLKLYKLSPYVEDDAFAYAEPAVEDLRQRLHIVERVAQTRGLPIAHDFQALYGSHFLRGNPVGNDLDYMLGVGLGAVRLDEQKPEVAAAELVSRIESYLQVLNEAFLRNSSTDLAVLQLTPLENGRFKDHDLVLERLTASLRDVAKGRPHRLFTEDRFGVRMPAILPPDESYIATLPRLQFLSNRVWSVDWMYVGIRRAQMVVHFFCDLEIQSPIGPVRTVRNLPLHPAFLPTGKLLDIREQLMWAVPTDTRSAVLFSENALSDLGRMTATRIDLARQFLSEVKIKLAVGDRVKAFKRLQQAGETLSPVLDSETRSDLDLQVAAALGNPDILASRQVVEMASSARYVFGMSSLLRLYRDSGDLQRLLRQISDDMNVLLTRHKDLNSSGTEEIITQLNGLISLLHTDFFAEGWDEAKDLLKTVKEWGVGAILRFSPPKQQVEVLLQAIQQRLHEAGIRVLPIYGLADNTVGVLSEDVDKIGLSGELGQAIVLSGGPDLDYRLITSTELPIDQGGQTLPPSYSIWLRRPPAPRQSPDSPAIGDVLAQDAQRFRRIPSTDTASLEESGRDLFLSRFGASGQQAWEATTTRGMGLLALLAMDMEEARQLLITHLEIIGSSPEAAKVMPLDTRGDSGFQLALQQALRHTAEGILEGLAIGRRSNGRRGLDRAQATSAQQQLASFINAIAALADNNASVSVARATPAGWEEYRLSVDGQSQTMRVLLTPEVVAGHSPGIEFSLTRVQREAVAEPLILRLALSPSGAHYELSFSSDRVNWGVHGRRPGAPFAPDNLFYDGLPARYQAPSGPLEREVMNLAFARYLEERFLPEVIADLPSASSR